jgi:uncharacterized damage-inducible protein DinB
VGRLLDSLRSLEVTDDACPISFLAEWMTPVKEPSALSELDNYLQRIEDLRGQVGKQLTGLPAEALNWRPIKSADEHVTNSLAVLTTHIAGAEHFWIAEVVGGLPSTRDRDAEFSAQASDYSELARLLENTGAETRDVFATLTEPDLDGTREARGRTTPVRWCILHVIDHTALHLGHMQLTCQLWAEGQSEPSPFWYERLPGD